MSHLDADSGLDIDAVRSQARTAGHIQRAQTMLLVAGLAAFGIVAVAGAMLTTLL